MTHKKIFFLSLVFFILLFSVVAVSAKQQTCTMRMISENSALCSQSHKIKNRLCAGGDSPVTGKKIVASFVDKDGVPVPGLFSKSSVVSCSERDYVCALPCDVDAYCRRGGEGATLNPNGLPDRRDCAEFQLILNSKSTSELLQEFPSLDKQIEGSDNEFKLPKFLNELFSSSLVVVDIELNSGSIEQYTLFVRSGAIIDVEKGQSSKSQIKVMITEEVLDKILASPIKKAALEDAFESGEITYEPLTAGAKFKLGLVKFKKSLSSFFKKIFSFFE